MPADTASTEAVTPTPAADAGNDTAVVERLLQQGAEGKLYIGHHRGERCLIKERFVKAYRHPDLDRQLTRERMRAESKAIQRCQAIGIRVPRLLNMDLETRRLHMEYLEHSCTVKHYIAHVLASVAADAERFDRLLVTLGERIGGVIGQMHRNHIIHGDLTTSNMLLEPTAGVNTDADVADRSAAGVRADDAYALVMIDFGLAHYHTSAEDKGVDLYVLERALLSTHSACMPRLFDVVLAAYQGAGAGGDTANGCAEVIAKFEDVRARGRKRTMIG